MNHVRYYAYVHTIKPTVLTDVAKLTEFASVSIASSLWNHGESILPVFSSRSEKRDKYYREWSRFSAEIYKLTNQLPIPKSVAEDLNEYVHKMEKEISIWVSYHSRKAFLNELQVSVLHHLIHHHIAWYPDATINCQQTAKNMFTCVRLSKVLKFRLLSTYCLKEEMEQISQMFLNTRFVNYFQLREHPLFYYWSHYFTYDLNKIPITGNINIFMFQHTNVDYWTAKEYFFDLLNFNDQVQQAMWLIDKHGILYQSLILKKLNETQRLLVYMDRAVRILLNYSKSETDHEEFSSTWSNVRNLITQQQFVTLFHELLVQSDKMDDLLIDLWSTASDDFKLHLFNYNNHEIFEKVLCLWKWSDENGLLFKMLSFASPCTRKYLIKEEFFVKYCDNLLGFEKMAELDRLLEFFLPEKEEFITFKQNLILNSKSLRTRCLKLYSTGKIVASKIFLRKFLLPEHIDQYKKEFLMSSDGILKYVIRNSSVKIEHIISTILDFRHLITQDRLAFLFCELVKARPVDVILKPFWDLLPQDMKLSLLSYNDNEVIEKIFNSLEGGRATEFILVLLQDVTSDVRKEITKKPFFEEYCENLLSTKKFALVTRLMNLCLPNRHEDWPEFQRRLAYNSKSLRGRCLSYFSSGNGEPLFKFQQFFSRPDPNLYLEFRENLLTSNAGIERVRNYSVTNLRTLSTIIEDTFRSAILATKFKKKIMFLPSTLRKLRKSIKNRDFETVQYNLDRYLTSVEDKEALKLRLFGDPMKTVRTLLVEHGEHYYNDFLMWYFGDEKLIEQFRKKLAVDTIFIEMLKECIFQEYDLTPHSKVKRIKKIKFNCLDRFLIWYFREPDRAKKYKLERINSLKDIAMFHVLLKASYDRHLKAVMEWFFENDREEIRKFKAKYSQKDRKICEMI